MNQTDIASTHHAATATIDDWVDELVDLQLPALAYNRTRLQQATARSVVGHEEIVAILCPDPGLFTRLYRELTQSPFASLATSTSPSRIVGLLGTDRVRRLASDMPVMEEIYHGRSLKQLKTSYGRALHSAAFAGCLASLRGKFRAEDDAAAGLMQNLGEMILAARKPFT